MVNSTKINSLMMMRLLLIKTSMVRTIDSISGGWSFWTNKYCSSWLKMLPTTSTYTMETKAKQALPRKAWLWLWRIQHFKLRDQSYHQSGSRFSCWNSSIESLSLQMLLSAMHLRLSSLFTVHFTCKQVSFRISKILNKVERTSWSQY